VGHGDEHISNVSPVVIHGVHESSQHTTTCKYVCKQVISCTVACTAAGMGDISSTLSNMYTMMSYVMIHHGSDDRRN
jgi:hypothetical protein